MMTRLSLSLALAATCCTAAFAEDATETKSPDNSKPREVEHLHAAKKRTTLESEMCSKYKHCVDETERDEAHYDELCKWVEAKWHEEKRALVNKSESEKAEVERRVNSIHADLTALTENKESFFKTPGDLKPLGVRNLTPHKVPNRGLGPRRKYTNETPQIHRPTEDAKIREMLKQRSKIK